LISPLIKYLRAFPENPSKSVFEKLLKSILSLLSSGVYSADSVTGVVVDVVEIKVLSTSLSVISLLLFLFLLIAARLACSLTLSTYCLALSSALSFLSFKFSSLF